MAAVVVEHDAMLGDEPAEHDAYERSKEGGEEPDGSLSGFYRS